VTRTQRQVCRTGAKAAVGPRRTSNRLRRATGAGAPVSNFDYANQENDVNHFGIAFGVIVATVIGGAIVFDRSLENKTIAQPQPTPAAAATQPLTEPAAAETSASAVAKQSTVETKQPAVAQLEVKERASAEANQPVREVKQRPARTQRTFVASAPDSAPAPLNVEPATPAPAAAPSVTPAPAAAASEPAMPAAPQPASSGQSD
jgi:hypothetical protein